MPSASLGGIVGGDKARELAAPMEKTDAEINKEG